MRHRRRNTAIAFTILAGALPLCLPLDSPTGLALITDAVAADNPARQDYENRKASFRALSDALDRESRKAGIDSTATLGTADLRAKEAARLAAAGEYDIARRVLDDGYTTLKTALARLENARSQKDQRDQSTKTPPLPATPSRQSELVGREIDSTRALLAALKRQDGEKKGGKATEIAAIEAEVKAADSALKAGEAERAGALIHDAYLRTKLAIAGLQQPSDMKSGSAAQTETARLAANAVSGNAAGMYSRRHDSVVALLATGQRIAAEKGVTRPEFAQTEALIKEADGLVGSGKFDDGRKRLDHAYLLVKETIRALRAGEQLTASKDFANPKDEYHYEQSRNDDYRNLIAGVVAGEADPAWKKSADKAVSLRAEAEALFKTGDFISALRRIEESTGQFKSILRSAGFPIL